MFGGNKLKKDSCFLEFWINPKNNQHYLKLGFHQVLEDEDSSGQVKVRCTKRHIGKNGFPNLIVNPFEEKTMEARELKNGKNFQKLKNAKDDNKVLSFLKDNNLYWPCATFESGKYYSSPDGQELNQHNPKDVFGNKYSLSAGFLRGDYDIEDYFESDGES